MEYSFLDQDLARQYETEQQLVGLFGIFSGLFHSDCYYRVGWPGIPIQRKCERKRSEFGKFSEPLPRRIMLMMNSQYIRLIFMH